MFDAIYSQSQISSSEFPVFIFYRKSAHLIMILYEQIFLLLVEFVYNDPVMDNSWQENLAIFLEFCKGVKIERFCVPCGEWFEI